jgi:D-3-phosphoglycerate dehydrogenase
MVDDYSVEVPPSRNMLVVRNADVPGMIGRVCTEIGQSGVNISDMALGRSPEGERALMLLSTDQPVPEELVTRITAMDGVRAAHPVVLE